MDGKSAQTPPAEEAHDDFNLALTSPEVSDNSNASSDSPSEAYDYQQYTDFFNKNTSWGKNFEEYQVMLAAQLEAKEKMDKKKKKPKK